MPRYPHDPKKKRDRTPLPKKARRVVKSLSLVYGAQVSRYITVLEKTAEAESLTAARTLVRAAKDGMTPGTLAWAHTSQVLATPSARSFCSYCGVALFGSPPGPRPECPLSTINEPCQNRDSNEPPPSPSRPPS